MHTLMFTAALYATPKGGSNYTFIGGWLGKQNAAHLKLEYWFSLKKEGRLPYVITWTKDENIMLNEIYQSQKRQKL